MLRAIFSILAAIPHCRSILPSFHARRQRGLMKHALPAVLAFCLLPAVVAQAAAEDGKANTDKAAAASPVRPDEVSAEPESAPTLCRAGSPEQNEAFPSLRPTPTATCPYGVDALYQRITRLLDTRRPRGSDDAAEIFGLPAMSTADDHPYVAHYRTKVNGEGGWGMYLFVVELSPAPFEDDLPPAFIETGPGKKAHIPTRLYDWDDLSLTYHIILDPGPGDKAAPRCLTMRQLVDHLLVMGWRERLPLVTDGDPKPFYTGPDERSLVFSLVRPDEATDAGMRTSCVRGVTLRLPPRLTPKANDPKGPDRAPATPGAVSAQSEIAPTLCRPVSREPNPLFPDLRPESTALCPYGVGELYQRLTRLLDTSRPRGAGEAAAILGLPAMPTQFDGKRQARYVTKASGDAGWEMRLWVRESAFPLSEDMPAAFSYPPSAEQSHIPTRLFDWDDLDLRYDIAIKVPRNDEAARRCLTVRQAVEHLHATGWRESWVSLILGGGGHVEPYYTAPDGRKLFLKMMLPYRASEEDMRTTCIKVLTLMLPPRATRETDDRPGPRK